MPVNISAGPHHTEHPVPERDVLESASLLGLPVVQLPTEKPGPRSFLHLAQKVGYCSRCSLIRQEIHLQRKPLQVSSSEALSLTAAPGGACSQLFSAFYNNCQLLQQI